MILPPINSDFRFTLYRPNVSKSTTATGKYENLPCLEVSRRRIIKLYQSWSFYIRHLFTDLRLDHFCHEIRHGARRIEFTGRTGALQLTQDGFVDFSESVTLLRIGEVQLIDDVDDLTKQYAVFHIVVRVFECGFYDGFFDGSLRREDRKSTRLNSSHPTTSRMPSSA